MTVEIPSIYALWQYWKQIEASLEINELASNISENASDEDLKTFDKQEDLIKQRKLAFIAKNKERKQAARKKELQASNKNLKDFFHPPKVS